MQANHQITIDFGERNLNNVIGVPRKGTTLMRGIFGVPLYFYPIFFDVGENNNSSVILRNNRSFSPQSFSV
ncbi:hypothetical protein IB62_006720 [Xanthomonas euvesicatoria]|nr:hypothetical protein IB62_006720 [Xanthomonas euvesicatoria]